MCQSVRPSFPSVGTHSVSAAGCGGLLSVTGCRVARRCVPVCPGTQGWSSCLQGPPGCRRGDPSSSRQSQLCCHCHLDRKKRKQTTSHTVWHIFALGSLTGNLTNCFFVGCWDDVKCISGKPYDFITHLLLHFLWHITVWLQGHAVTFYITFWLATCASEVE